MPQVPTTPEIDSLRELTPFLRNHGASWLILDIDQTTIRSPQMWGSEPWYHYRIQKYREAGQSVEAATLAANDDWEKAQATIEPVPMEAETVALISGWQKLSFRTLALTARSIAMLERTRAQLSHAGIDFSVTSPPPAFFRVTADAVYDRGILYVGPLNNKGALFRRWIEGAPRRPDHLVFVDDRQEHVESMSRHAQALGITYDGFRFRAADPYAAAFDPDALEHKVPRR